MVPLLFQKFHSFIGLIPQKQQHCQKPNRKLSILLLYLFAYFHTLIKFEIIFFVIPISVWYSSGADLKPSFREPGGKSTD